MFQVEEDTGTAKADEKVEEPPEPIESPEPPENAHTPDSVDAPELRDFVTGMWNVFCAI